MSQQLVLNIRLDDTATFNNFYEADNQLLAACLHKMAKGSGESFVYCWGSSGTGRSHLLQACCHAATQQGRKAAYVPLSHVQALSPEIFNGLEAFSLVCLDDIDGILGNLAWEVALFHFYNRVHDAKTSLLISADRPPQQLPCTLPDLASRLRSALVFQTATLSDEEKLAALQLRAKQRGFILKEKVGRFLLHHESRDFLHLFKLLEKLDQASFVQQRRLTIPFLKSVLYAPTDRLTD